MNEIVDPTGVALLGIVAGGAAGAIASAVQARRQSRRIRSLLERLERLAAAPPEVPPETPVADAPASAGPQEGSLSHVTADVLAGRTVEVQALLAAGDRRGLSLADRAILEIYRRLGEPLAPSRLAAALHVSLRSLERGLAMALGCTPRELVTAVRMREARRLLESGELNVTGVAIRLGFSSPSHFSKSFRRFYHRNPSEVAQAARERSRVLAASGGERPHGAGETAGLRSQRPGASG